MTRPGQSASEWAEEQRDFRRLARAARTVGNQSASTCPDCGASRSNPEALRAHRVIAHGVDQ